jgi:uncharacterized membrane protein
MDDKTKSIVAHVTIIGWIIALVMNQSDKGENTSFYLRQMLGLVVIGAVGYIAGSLTISIISTIVSLVTLVLWILSLIWCTQWPTKACARCRRYVPTMV